MQHLYGGRVPRKRMLAMTAFALTSVGILLGFRFFGAQAGVISVFFSVLGILPTLELLIERNKRKSSELAATGLAPEKLEEDARLASALLALFLAIMFAYGLAALIVSAKQIEVGFSAQLGPWLTVSDPSFQAQSLPGILLHNLGVAAGVLLLSVLYRTGGALLVLAWNASIWGAAFAYFARSADGEGLAAFGTFAAIIACILPHIVLEALAYIMTALAGIVVVRGFARTGASVASVRGMALNATLLCGAAVMLLCGAALLEVTLAPTLLSLV